MSTTEKDGFGLDKKSRLEANRMNNELEEAEPSAALDPPFPYVMVPFDSVFFES